MAPRIAEREALAGDARGVWCLAESLRWVDRGATRAWDEARVRVTARHGPIRARRFLAELVRRSPGLPSVLVLQAARTAADPAEAIAWAEARVRALWETPFATLRDTPFDALPGVAASLSPERLASTSLPWTVEEWARTLRQARGLRWGAHRESSGIATLPPPVRAALSQGLVPPGVPVVRDLPGTSLQLRYLQSGPELRTFLRFADCVPCCWRHPPRRVGWSLRWVLRVWRDPSAFCFHVERVGTEEPCGFVFGWFVPGVDGERTVALNGVYLRRPRPELRDAVLRGIEVGLCRALGVRSVLVANLYGGAGPLPARYTACPPRHSAVEARQGLLGDLRSARTGSHGELFWTRL